MIAALGPIVIRIIAERYGIWVGDGSSTCKFAVSYLFSSASTSVFLALVLIGNDSIWNKSKVQKLVREVLIGPDGKNNSERPNLQIIHLLIKVVSVAVLLATPFLVN